MKKIFLLALLMSLSCMSYAKNNAETLDKIVAVVNDEVVTKSELTRTLLVMKAQIAQEHIATPNNSVLQKQALDQLINKKLQIQMAKQAGINITDTDVDRVVENIAEKNNLPVEALYQRINQDGMSKADYRAQLHEQMTIQKLQQQEVGGRLTVTTDEINRFMKAKSWQSNNTNKEFKLEDILISLSDAPSTEELQKAKQRAQVVMNKIKQGKAANDLAQTNDLGWRKTDDMPSAFAQVAANMRVREVAGPIQTGNGLHILRLVAERNVADEKGSRGPNRTEAQQLLMQRKFAENLQNWISKMRSQAFVTINNS